VGELEALCAADPVLRVCADLVTRESTGAETVSVGG
jgi:hypothetical protein